MGIINKYKGVIEEIGLKVITLEDSLRYDLSEQKARRIHADLLKLREREQRITEEYNNLFDNSIHFVYLDESHFIILYGGLSEVEIREYLWDLLNCKPEKIISKKVGSGTIYTEDNLILGGNTY